MYQKLLEELGTKYNVPIPSFKISSELYRKETVLGAYDCYTNTIIIDEMVFHINIDVEKLIYHEFRHAWQYKYYKNLYKWWLKKENTAIYDKYYNTLLCSIEEDAREFGKTKGRFSREDLINLYSPQKLTEMRDTGQLDLAVSYLEMFY